MKRLVMATSLVVLASCGAHDRNKPPTGSADLRVADAAMAGGMPQTAINVTREILQSDPRNIGALLRQGEALRRWANLTRPGNATSACSRSTPVGRRAPRPWPG